MNILDLSEQEIIRRNSLDEMRKLGIEPYPAAEYPVNAYSQEIKNNFVSSSGSHSRTYYESAYHG